MISKKTNCLDCDGKSKTSVVQRGNTDGNQAFDILYHAGDALFKAMVSPELYQEIRFPSLFPLPTYCYRTKSSFYVRTNSYGNAFIEIHMGQYCDTETYKDGITKKNGTSTVGNSNIFICDDETLTGLSAVSNDANVMKANDTGVIKYAGLFNSVRAGPASVSYSYAGDVTNVKGHITMGFGYMASTTPAGSATPCNNLVPEPIYSVTSFLEDSLYSKTEHVMTSMKAIYSPQDYSQLTLKAPNDAVSTNICQRLYIAIQAAQPNTTIGYLTFTQNWEGIPSPKYSDMAKLSLSTFPDGYTGNDVFTYIVRNNLIITKDDSEFGDFPKLPYYFR